MKKLLAVLVILVLSVTILCALRDRIIKGAAEALLSNVAGARVTIGSLSLGLASQKIIIKEFKVHNPKGFTEGVLLELAAASIDYDLAALMKKRLYFKRVAIDLKEAVVIKDKEGRLNVDSLKLSKKEKETDESAEKSTAGIKIETLTLSLGRVIYADYSHHPKPLIEEFNIGVKSRVYKNITGANQLLVLILAETLKSTTIRSAGVYGAASLAGVGMLPVGVGYLLTRKDDASQVFNYGFERVYVALKHALNFLGTVTHENKTSGRLTGRIGLAEVIVKIEKAGISKTRAVVSARKLLLPEQRIAGGLLYQASENLKRN